MATPSIVGRYESAEQAWSDPAVECEDITSQKSDTVNLTNGNTRGLFCNGAGVVKVTFVGQPISAPVTLTLLAGVVYPFAIKQLWNASLTATGVHALR